MFEQIACILSDLTEGEVKATEITRDTKLVADLDLTSLDVVNAIVAFTSDLKGNNCGLKQYRNTYSREKILSGLSSIIQKKSDLKDIVIWEEYIVMAWGLRRMRKREQNIFSRLRIRDMLQHSIN
ncbi:MAG: hypothetical protein J6W73_00680 [Verrucomicrobia bacterium]|nr:hypothetical protein [Verrucomicrobiota bacterium]